MKCIQCNDEPRIKGRTVGYQCYYKRRDESRRKQPTSEYKIGRFGFVYMRVGDDWIKSSLTPWEVRLLTGERLSA
jgi:hypothetical protein